MKPDDCRFCRLYALVLVPVAVVLGALLTAQTAFVLRGSAVLPAPRPLGQSELLISLVHAVAPAANGSALMIALVWWLHPLAGSVLALQLPQVLKRAALVSIPGFALATLLSWAASFALGVGILDIPSGAFSMSALRADDVVFGVVATLFDATLVLLLAWRFSPRLQAARLSLPAKLIVSCTVLFPLRALCGLVLQANLPG